jgi:hypothetical protein
VHPLAVVLLGGLVTTALITLFGLPALYRHTPTVGTAAAGPMPADHDDTPQRATSSSLAQSGNGWEDRSRTTTATTEDRP